MSTKRFRIAFSFAGEKRDFVAKVAAMLADRFGEVAILYDKFHEAEFGNWKLGLILQELYHDDSDMIVIVVCPDYMKKDWCGLEWIAIHGMLMSGKDREIMLCRFEHARLQGLNENAGFVELDHKTPEQAATLILERLALNEGKPKDHYKASVAPTNRPAKTCAAPRPACSGHLHPAGLARPRKCPRDSRGMRVLSIYTKRQEIDTLRPDMKCPGYARTLAQASLKAPLMGRGFVARRLIAGWTVHRKRKPEVL